MGMSEREHHIKVLEQFLHDYQEWGEDLELEKTIKYAISSLKTDEAYQLMYERVKVYTQDEVVDMFDKIKSRIEALHSPISGNDFGYGYISGFVDSSKIVQEQINALKEDRND